jgi:hypothetical protein
MQHFAQLSCQSYHEYILCLEYYGPPPQFCDQVWPQSSKLDAKLQGEKRNQVFPFRRATSVQQLSGDRLANLFLQPSPVNPSHAAMHVVTNPQKHGWLSSQHYHFSESISCITDHFMIIQALLRIDKCMHQASSHKSSRPTLRGWWYIDGRQRHPRPVARAAGPSKLT